MSDELEFRDVTNIPTASKNESVQVLVVEGMAEDGREGGKRLVKKG